MALELGGKPMPQMGRPRTSAPVEKDPFAVALGGNIRRARDDAKLTARELARRIGYDPAQLSKVESGLAVPRSDTLAKIAREVNRSPGSLYPGQPEPITPPAADAVGTGLRLPAELGSLIDEVRREALAASEAAEKAQATADEAMRLLQRRGRGSA